MLVVFLDWVLVTPVCPLCENTLAFTLVICALVLRLRYKVSKDVEMGSMPLLFRR